MIKKLSIAILFVFLFLFVDSCKKSEPDYRLPFTGEFTFKTIKNVISMCYDSSETCMDGWEILSSDTTLIKTFIATFDEDRLEIEFGDGDIGIHDDSVLNEKFYPVIYSNGELSLQEYPRGGHNFFEGFFIGYDTLVLNFQYGFGIGGFAIYNVIGTRE